MLLGACSTTDVKPPEAAPAVQSLPEYMRQGSAALSGGSHEKARVVYREAAKAYPAAKEPWQRLAEDYFDARDYGNAILAAQEVILRDASDSVATSVLAVSGLRVSASALQSLRSQNGIAAGTRSEAETMAKTLREVLGESVLVPRPVAGASAPATASTAKARAHPVARKPAAQTAAPAENPFDKLK